MNSAYEKLNQEWGKTSKILFSCEVGELSGFESWLAELTEPTLRRKSEISGREVVFAATDYCANSKSVTLEESRSAQFSSPIGIDDAKDIDSLMRAAKERFHYAGNIVLGNSSFVEDSSAISDSNYVYRSARVFNSKNICCSTLVKESENVFGCTASTSGKFAVRSNLLVNLSRCFETWYATNCSDCYYSYHMKDSHDCFFCFNLRAKRNCIGNLELPREKYLSIKANLLEQLAITLKDKKSAPSLGEIVSRCGSPAKMEIAPLRRFARPESQMPASMQPIEEAFSKTAEALFGRPAHGLESHSEWLQRHVIKIKSCESCLGSGRMTRQSYANSVALPESRMVNFFEAEAMSGKLQITPDAAAAIRMENAPKAIYGIAFLSGQFREGEIRNVISTPNAVSSTNVFGILGALFLKNSAYCTWPLGSDHIFGCAFLLNSQFCIHCYQSDRLQGCFEVDSSSDCSRAYYCHNCENVLDSMFCFNTKNLQYAIGNKVVGREKFLQAKAALQAWLFAQLAKANSIQPDIYNLGCP